MTRKHILAIALLLIAGIVQAQSYENADKAFADAGHLNRPVLLIFSGSDWCAPCIRFEKQVAGSTRFIEYANAHLVILKADFPQRKKMTDDLRRQNETLAATYNPEGTFPLFVLLRDNGSVIGTVPYRDESPDQFINEIRSTLSDDYTE